MAQALPQNINLAAQKPTAVNSYVRRYRNIQRNANGDNLQGTDIIIPIDTGTPGAFLDGAQSYLQFDLKIYNQNPYIDFIDLGPAGVASFFEQLQIRCNGSPIETIKDYGTVVEHWMKLEGIAQERFEMYQQRKEAMGVGSIYGNELNHCKAPMVDMIGRIMNSTSATVATAGTTGTLYPIGSNVNNSAGTVIPTQGFSPYSSSAEPFVSQSSIFTSNMRNYTLKAGMTCQAMFDSTNINMWPQMIGIDQNFDSIYEKNSLRFQDYMTYLANVKNIPIGCTSSLTPTAGVTGGVAAGGTGWVVPYTNTPGLVSSPTVGTYNAGFFQGTFNIPLISGLIGILQPKMVPTMLLDNFELVMTCASNSKPMKVSMDPCRRIPGTHRDFLTYYGNVLGSITGAAVSQTNQNQLLPATLNGQIADNALNGLNSLNYYPVQVCMNPLLGRGTNGNAGTSSTPIPNIAAGGQLTPLGAFDFFPSHNLVPQYYQSTACINGKVPASLYGYVLNNIGNDGFGCYGTFLKNSVAQTARCIQNTTLTQPVKGITYDKVYSDTNQGNLQYMPWFSISNVYFVAQQVIVPDAVTAEILASSVHGDISMQSGTIQVYNNINCTAGSGSQNLIIPAKCGSANTLLGIFRHPTQVNYGLKQYLVNSLCGYCPIGCAVYTPDSVSYVGTTNKPSITYVPAFTGGANGFSFQLSIGNDLQPAQPMITGVELLSELEKCQHGLHTRYNNMAYGNTIIPSPTSTETTDKSSGSMVFDIFKDGGYFTAWVDPFALNDQTIVNNMSWPLLLPEELSAAQNQSFWTPVPVGPYMVNQFKHPDGNFVIGFDLDTWSAFSDVAMSGRYFGNNTISLKCDGLRGLAEDGSNTWQFTAIIMCDCRWSFQAGGNSQVFI